METIRIAPEQKMKLTSYNLALAGWRTSLELLTEIRTRGLKPSFGMFEGLMVGACTLYARPFKRAKGLVRLDDLASFTGQRDEAYFSSVHQAALEARDLVLAHQDVAKWYQLLKDVPGARRPDEATVTVLAGNLGIEAGMLLPQGNLHELLPDLIAFQIRRLEGLRFNLVAGILPPSFFTPAQFRIEAIDQTTPAKNDSVTKLEGHVDHLFTGYMNALAEYRLVAPMLYDKATVQHFGKGERAPGYQMMRYALYRHIVQECWKLACDKDKRSPSIAGIMEVLEQPGVREYLRSRYSRLRIPIADGVNADTRRILEYMEAADDENRGLEFDALWQRVHDSWASFESLPFREGIATLRDKVTAHTELRLVDGRYERVDLAGTVRFGDERRFLEAIKPIITDLNLLIRQTSFDWTSFDQHTEQNAKAYWAIESVQDGT